MHSFQAAVNHKELFLLFLTLLILGASLALLGKCNQNYQAVSLDDLIATELRC